jgi:hypothetical protein
VVPVDWRHGRPGRARTAVAALARGSGNASPESAGLAARGRDPLPWPDQYELVRRPPLPLAGQHGLVRLPQRGGGCSSPPSIPRSATRPSWPCWNRARWPWAS